MKFDASNYEIPNQKSINFEKTKYNVGVFLSTYLASRESLGYPREPEIISIAMRGVPDKKERDESFESIGVKLNDQFESEYNYLNTLFVKGYSAIQHINPSKTERMKRIFYDRYIRGCTVYETGERNSVSKDVVTQNGNLAIVQFAAALEIIVHR